MRDGGERDHKSHLTIEKVRQWGVEYMARRTIIIASVVNLLCDPVVYLTASREISGHGEETAILSPFDSPLWSG